MPRHHKALVFVSIILFITSKTLQIFKNIVAGTPMKTTTYTTSHLLLHSQFYCGILDYVGAWVRLDLPPNTFKTHHPILDESLSYSLRAPMHVIFLSS